MKSGFRKIHKKKDKFPYHKGFFVDGCWQLDPKHAAKS